MKTSILSLIAVMTVSSFSVWAQPPQGKPFMGKNPKEVRQVTLPERGEYFQGLSDEQRAEIKKIHMERMKERTQTRSLLNEKRAKLEVLQTADKPDMKEINKTIDEIASVKAQEMKAQAANRQKIRSLLTEEQRIYFDARPDKIVMRKEYCKDRCFDGNERFKRQRNFEGRSLRNFDKGNSDKE